MYVFEILNEGFMPNQQPKTITLAKSFIFKICQIAFMETAINPLITKLKRFLTYQIYS